MQARRGRGCSSLASASNFARLSARNSAKRSIEGVERGVDVTLLVGEPVERVECLRDVPCSRIRSCARDPVVELAADQVAHHVARAPAVRDVRSGGPRRRASPSAALAARPACVAAGRACRRGTRSSRADSRPGTCRRPPSGSLRLNACVAIERRPPPPAYAASSARRRPASTSGAWPPSRAAHRPDRVLRAPRRAASGRPATTGRSGP